MKRMRRSRGFTLLELIVVIAAFAVLSGIGVRVFYSLTDAWKSVQVRAELDAKAEYAFDQMGRDFAEILSPALSGLSLESPADDEVIMPVQRIGGPAGRQQAGKVMYHLKRDGATPALYRTVGPLDASGGPAGASTIVAQGVSRMLVEYLEPGRGDAWQARWTGQGMPEAVRVSLIVTDPDRYWETIARKSTFLINLRG